MAFQSAMSAYRAKEFEIMFGVSTQAIADAAMVLGLANKSTSPQTTVRDFVLNAPTGSGLYMYFASPVSAGLVQFLDVDSTFIGGWDGAHDNPYDVYGPLILDITLPSGVTLPYYVYRTDYSELGTSHWNSSPAP